MKFERKERITQKIAMKNAIKIPSKTFLLGEYSVLVGGSAIVINTSPNFLFQKKQSDNQSIKEWVSPKSAAGVFQNNIKIEQIFNIQDPHWPSGGFGRSSAEFIAAAESVCHLEPWKTFDEYIKIVSDSASGVDVLSQCLGGIVYIDKLARESQNLTWSFNNIDFAILKTPFKIQTHEHLKNLQKDKFKSQNILVEIVRSSFISGSQEQFLCGLNDFISWQMSMGFIEKNAAELKLKIEQLNLFKIVKPCGALGADTILVIFEKNMSLSWFESKINELGLKIIATSKDITNGAVYC
jgi:hypothetical protein